jgi:hypothetical protein
MVGLVSKQGAELLNEVDKLEEDLVYVAEFVVQLGNLEVLTCYGS